MSMVSIPQQEVVYNLDKSCDPAKITLTFREVQNAPLQHSKETRAETSTQPKQKPVQKFVKIVQNQPKKEVEDDDSSKARKILKKREYMKRRRDEFLEKGIKTALFGAIELKVQCACKRTDRLLEDKRTRLRELLLAEEVAYATEYVAMCQQANINRKEEIRIHALELQSKKERERKQLAAEKLLMQKIQTCESARPAFTQKALMEIKQDQLWQIKEKHALEEARREEDRMYHDLMIKNMISLKENEEENAKLAWIKQKNVQKAFIEQMKWKEQKEEEERQLKEDERVQLEKELRLIKEENEKEFQEKMRKNAQIKAEIQEIIEKEKKIKEKRRREEEEIDRTFTELLKMEEEKEKRKEVSNKERLKREMDVFLEKSRELKRQREEDERKLDELLEELNEKKKAQKDAERRKLKAAREEQLCRVIMERDEQIREKRAREKREEEQAQREIELLTLQIEQQRKLREEYERRCAEERNAYRCQLLQQIQEVNDEKRRKKEEEEEYLRLKREKEEREIEEVKALVRALPIAGKDHPMKAIIKEMPPKYVCPYPCPR